MKVNRNREKNIYFTVRINTYIMEIYMERNYYGKLKVKVTANGCGIPLSGACIYINGKRFVVPQDNNGFSDVITLFEEFEIRLTHFYHAYMVNLLNPIDFFAFL